MKIKNLKKAAERILKAIKNREKIILYGDADIDGSSSVIILQESIQALGGKIKAIYFPNREVEGYGISEKGLKHLKKFSPALLIAVDCGIGNFKEIDLANKLGFEVIVIDHHQVLGKIPNALIVVDPKQKGDKYPFKELAATGIVFILSELLLKNKMTTSLRQKFLELTALATIADMMPQEQDNKFFVEQGLITIENSSQPSLKAFFENKSLKEIVNLNEKISKLVSILNIREIENGMPVSFQLLTSSTKQKSQKIIKRLFKKSQLKKEKIDKIIEEINWQVIKNPEPIIFIGSSEWEFGFISTLASITCNKHKKPTFIFKKELKESQGAVRTPSDINSVFLMEKCSKYLLTFGGHPRASGFRMKNENLEKFKKCLLQNYA